MTSWRPAGSFTAKNCTLGAKVSKLYAGKLRQHTDIRVGFVILKINGASVDNKEDLTAMLESQKGKKIEIEGYYPGHTRLYSYSFDL